MRQWCGHALRKFTKMGKFSVFVAALLGAQAPKKERKRKRRKKKENTRTTPNCTSGECCESDKQLSILDDKCWKCVLVSDWLLTVWSWMRCRQTEALHGACQAMEPAGDFNVDVDQQQTWVQINEPFPAAQNDKKCSTNPDGKRGVADNGCCVNPKKLDLQHSTLLSWTSQRGRLKKRAKACHEKFNLRQKAFGILDQAFCSTGGSCLEKHKAAFEACTFCIVVHCEMDNDHLALLFVQIKHASIAFSCMKEFVLCDAVHRPLILIQVVVVVAGVLGRWHCFLFFFVAGQSLAVVGCNVVLLLLVWNDQMSDVLPSNCLSFWVQLIFDPVLLPAGAGKANNNTHNDNMELSVLLHRLCWCQLCQILLACCCLDASLLFFLIKNAEQSGSLWIVKTTSACHKWFLEWIMGRPQRRARCMAETMKQGSKQNKKKQCENWQHCVDSETKCHHATKNTSQESAEANLLLRV